MSETYEAAVEIREAVNSLAAEVRELRAALLVHTVAVTAGGMLRDMPDEMPFDIELAVNRALELRELVIDEMEALRKRRKPPPTTQKHKPTQQNEDTQSNRTGS